MRALLAAALALGVNCVPTNNFDAGEHDAAVDPSDSGTPPAWTVALFAGGGGMGLRDGAPGVAQFNLPTALTMDRAGTLYVADTGNRVIRKVDTAGTVSTVYTTRNPGFMDPRGVALDGRGNLFVSDTADHCVYQVSSTGQLSAFTGSCSLGDAGFHSCGDAYYAVGGRTAADVGSPTGLLVDADAGVLYIADEYHELVRFAPFNQPFLGTLAGRGDTTAFFDGPCGKNYCCGTQWNIPECSAAQSAAFRGPSALAQAPNGDLLVADRENCAIRRITTPTAAACRVSTVTGAGCGTGTTSQTLNGPMGVAAGPGGVVYVSDTNNQRVVQVDPSQPVGLRVSALAGSGQVSNPWGLATAPDGRLFVVDTGTNSILVLTPPLP